jgi:N-acetylated-alpha-linked acidic dipeptidase
MGPRAPPSAETRPAYTPSERGRPRVGRPIGGMPPAALQRGTGTTRALHWHAPPTTGGSPDHAMVHPGVVAVFACVAAAGISGVLTHSQGAPPSRELLLELTSGPRLAGTSGSWRGARFVGGVLERAGWSVEYDERVVLLSMLKSLRLAVHADGAPEGVPLLERRERFDADLVPPGDVPAYSAWSASGQARGPVVDVGRGLRADFERLRTAGVELRGSVALARYGGSYRGVKVDLATEYGCAAVLLFNDPAEDGAGRGDTWPQGPWKPDTSAQRGSISPMGRAPGDPSTPGFPSPRPGEAVTRLSGEALAAALPRVPCTPIGAREALYLLERLREAPGPDGQPRKLGPGPVEVDLTVDAPRELRTIVNVVGTLPGGGPELVIAGNHRDAWVRGANDAGSGTVALLRAAQRLGLRAQQGWRPRHTLVMGFWDAEEFSLIGSTEWAEAHAERLAAQALVYVNADTAVSGTRFGASGSPGMLGSLLAVLDGIPAAGGQGTLASEWRASFPDGAPSLGLPGSGSDFAVFLHHLAVPVIDFGFGGNSAGQYHTEFDDFALVERTLDPGFVGHELAGLFVERLLADFADRDQGGFDDAEAARAMVQLVRSATQESGSAPWLTAPRGERLVSALEQFAARSSSRRGPRLYSAAADPEGLPGRPWYRNPFWAPGLETGYSAETLPTLRAAARRGEQALDLELDRLVARLSAALPAAPPPSAAGEAAESNKERQR